MDKDTYCITVCKGKCCTLYPEGVRCPRQEPSGACGIYEERYAPEGSPDIVIVGFYKNRQGHLRPFHCGKIEQLLERNELPPEIRQQCCYAHPELLEAFDDDEV